MSEKDAHHHESGGSAESRRRRRRRCLIYFLLFIVFKAAIILILALTIFRTRTPKFRVTAAAFGSVDYSSGAAAANPSFDIRLFAELSVRNTNFGRYKFRSTTVYFFYNGAVVGSAFVPGWRAGARSTRVINVEVELSSSTGSVDRVQLASDLKAGVLPLNGRSTLNGEVKVLQILKRDKTAELDCFIAVNLVPRTLGYLTCA